MLFREQNALIGLYKASKPTNLQVTEKLVSSWSWGTASAVRLWKCCLPQWIGFPRVAGLPGWQ